MFERLRLNHRILLGYSIPLLITLISFSVIYVNARRVEREQSLVDIANTTLIQVHELQRALNGMELAVYGYVIGRDEGSLKLHEELDKEFSEISRTLPKLLDSLEEQEILRRIIDSGKKVESADRKLIEQVKEGKRDQVFKLITSGGALKSAQDVQALINELEMKVNEDLRVSKNDSVHAFSILLKSIFAGIFLTPLLAVVIGIWVASRISRTLTGTISAMSATSSEIAATVVEHERMASQQAAMVNETTTTMEELGASSRQSAEQSESAVEIARKSSALAVEGNEIVTQAVEAMDDLKNKVGAVAERILRLGEKTGQIGNIAEILKDLATQINMLALNAAVEAARAGEHGKGFAVVASEVRKLAVESRKSAEQAKSIITDIQTVTNSTVISTEEGTQKVEEVTKLVRKVGEFFEELSEAAGSVYNNSQQVLLNARQQSAAINQVVSATNTINSGARETASGITQTKEGLLKLNEAAQTLQAMV